MKLTENLTKKRKMSSERTGKKRGGVRKKAQTAKRPRRANYEFPALEPDAVMKRRLDDVLDVQEYVHKLSPEEKAWMNQFMLEYNEAVTKNAVFHTTAEDRKICNDRNNARNRCDYTMSKAMDMLNYLESDYELEKILHTDIEEEEPSTEDDSF